jgi:enterochelin esterase-like enzyme
LFAGIGVLSPAIFKGTIPDRTWLYPDDGARGQHDPLLLSETAAIAGKRIFVGWGAEDYGWIISASRLLVDRLSTRGTDILHEQVPGEHDESTWRLLAPAMLGQLLGSP